ncbi:receptor like protein 27-like [Carya illinoinensis]|uniref:receptor like protein 27-like n=1 Tax=Carya illinoinensis TaxID=32201 RepID=UPI001C71A8A5|nr:receptor like protein 27-like [Carya illinoinensis]
MEPRIHKFLGEIPTTIGNLGSLNTLDLRSCNFSGSIPSAPGNLTSLIYLEISNNSFVGNIPSSIGNLIQLSDLDLSVNQLIGRIPFGHGNLTQLSYLSLRYNLLNGEIPFPLMNLTKLTSLQLGNNNLQGRIPDSIFNLKNLKHLDLGRISFSGSVEFGKCMQNFGASLLVIDLERNKFQGSIPQTWTQGTELRIINLRQNRFQGQLPRSLAKCMMLEVADFSDNKLHDLFPSLHDLFPSWLENLPNLKVLNLRSNNFHGQIGTSKPGSKFPNLRVIDLSHNGFTGKLPLEIFGNWKQHSEFANSDILSYIQVNSSIVPRRYTCNSWLYAYNYTMTMTNKGVAVFYEKVQELFKAIDISSNKFGGEISESIENLKGFHLHNLSNNVLTGHIPPSLANLTELESLDLSENNLSGEIPQQLTQLTFLGFFNVSNNLLTGPIPQGNQFGTFGNNSYEGNSELCGRPLSKNFEDSNASPAPPSLFPVDQSQKSGSPFQFGWEILVVVVVGYASGLVVGVTIGHIVITRKRDWFMNIFGIKQLAR